jgi:hypothetical protein
MAMTLPVLAAGLADVPRVLLAVAETAVQDVPGCSGACAVMPGSTFAATHPALAGLTERQFADESGPLLSALAGGSPVSCPDLAGETRWPPFAAAALARGVRCSAHVPGDGFVLELYAVRAMALSVEAAVSVAAFGQAVLANATAYGAAQRVASQFSDAVAARSVVDQAKGILMHAFGCDADEALRRLRSESQRRNVKVTDLAREVVQARQRR